MTPKNITIDGIEYDLVPKSSPDKKSERDWEIECFTDGYRNWWLQPNGFYTHQIFDCGLTASQLIRDKKIWAVRRKSDKVVFRVGDEVDSTMGKHKIDEFIISYDNKMFAGINNWNEPLEVISKLPERTKLFTTTSGEDVFIGDVYWYVDNRFKLYSIKACSTQDISKGDIQFISEDKAKEYITLNKPCLSIRDVFALWCIENPARQQLIELAKSKL